MQYYIILVLDNSRGGCLSFCPLGRQRDAWLWSVPPAYGRQDDLTYNLPIHYLLVPALLRSTTKHILRYLRPDVFSIKVTTNNLQT